MAYNPSGNYQLVKSGVWADRRQKLKNPVVNNLTQCMAICDTDSACDGFFYDSKSRGCETGAGTNFTSLHKGNPEFQVYRKIKQQPIGNGKYEGKQLQTSGPATSLFSVQQGARQAMAPNKGKGSCGGFNGFGGWKGWGNGFGPTMPNGNCPESFDLSMCPINLGTPKTGTYSTSTGVAGNFDTGELYVKCQYDSLDWSKLITNGSFNDNTGRQLLTDSAWTQAKNDYCVNWSNIDKTECVAWLQPGNAGSRSYNTVKMGLCTPPNVPDWTADTRCVNAINQVFKTGSDSEKNMANQMVNLACGTKPSSPACACYNATNRSVDQCLASPTLPGCKSIADKVGKYKTLGATFLTSALKPFCACDECTVAKTGSSGTVISQPAADQPGLCTDKINACFSQMTIGQMSGGTLNTGCTIQDINPPPPPPPGPLGFSSGGPPPPPLRNIGGFRN